MEFYSAVKYLKTRKLFQKGTENKIEKFQSIRASQYSPNDYSKQFWKNMDNLSRLDNFKKYSKYILKMDIFEKRDNLNYATQKNMDNLEEKNWRLIS